MHQVEEQSCDALLIGYPFEGREEVKMKTSPTSFLHCANCTLETHHLLHQDKRDQMSYLHDECILILNSMCLTTDRGVFRAP
ncbi:Deoxyribodipyrimidine photo-lyase mitochondrial [Bienertia sinuspersici]